MIYKKVLTEMAFGQEAGGSEAKGTASQAEGTGYAKALRQGGARWGKKRRCRWSKDRNGDSGDQTPFCTES